VSSSVLREKIPLGAILKENTANYMSLERLTNVDFGKKGIASFFNSTKENCKNDGENDNASLNQINEL